MGVSGSWPRLARGAFFCGGGDVLKLDFGWLAPPLFKLTKTHWTVHLRWVGSMVGHSYLENYPTVCLGLWIYLNQGEKATFLSPHCRPALPRTWALTLMPTNNKDSSLQNWKTKTGKNTQAEPLSEVPDYHVRISFSWQTRWLLTTKEEPWPPPPAPQWI